MTSRPEPTWDLLADGESLLSDPAELLWRQVSPSFFIDGDKISSQAFRPGGRDHGKMSTSRASVQSAAGAYDFHTNVRRLNSAGTWAITVEEVNDAGSRAVDDSKATTAPAPPCPPGHTFVDFRPYGTNTARRIGGLLLDAAVHRGRQHPP